MGCKNISFSLAPPPSLVIDSMGFKKSDLFRNACPVSSISAIGLLFLVDWLPGAAAYKAVLCSPLVVRRPALHSLIWNDRKCTLYSISCSNPVINHQSYKKKCNCPLIYDEFQEVECSGKLTSAFNWNAASAAGMGARGSGAVALKPVTYVSLPLIGVLLCFLHWELLRPREDPPRPPPPPSFQSACPVVTAQGLGFSGSAGEDGKGLSSTKFLKGPTV